jgi:hypothetical protein
MANRNMMLYYLELGLFANALEKIKWEVIL